MKNLETAIKVSASSLFSLYLCTHFVHFNVTGPDFYQLHKLLDEIYKLLFEEFDALGEQIRTLDIYTPASLSAFQQFSEIEDMNEVQDAKTMLYELLLDFEKVINSPIILYLSVNTNTQKC